MDQAGEGQDRENSSEDAENAEGEYEKEKEIINDDKGGTNDGKEKMTDDEEEAGMNTEVKDKQRSEEEAETEDSVSTKRMRRKKRMPDFQFSFNDTGDIDAGSLNDSYDDEGWVPPLKKKKVYESSDDSDYDSAGETKRKKKKTTDSQSTPQQDHSARIVLSPEVQKMIKKLGLKTADLSKQKQKLDEVSASLAIHRWGRQTGFTLSKTKLSKEDYEAILTKYGREGNGLISTTVHTLKKCWETTMCNEDKLHDHCELCEDAIWNDFGEDQGMIDVTIDPEKCIQLEVDCIQSSSPKVLDHEADEEGTKTHVSPDFRVDEGNTGVEENRESSLQPDVNWTESMPQKELDHEVYPDSSQTTQVNTSKDKDDKDVRHALEESPDLERQIEEKEEELRRLKALLEENKIKEKSDKCEDSVVTQDEQVKEDSKAYQCEFCTQKIKSSRDLIKHCQKKHNKEIEKPVKKLLYGCDSCGKVYSEEQTLKYHIKTVHHTERCKFCGEKNTHMKRHEEKCKKKQGKKDSKRKKKKCEFCGTEVVNLPIHLTSCKAGQGKNTTEKKSSQDQIAIQDTALNEAELQEEVVRQRQLYESVDNMMTTAVLMGIEVNITLVPGVRTAATGSCLVEAVSDQINNRKPLEEEELTFSEVLNDLGKDQCTHERLRENVVDLLETNEEAFKRFTIAQEGKDLSEEELTELRREAWANELDKLRQRGEYNVSAADLMVDGVCAFLRLPIVIMRTSSPVDYPFDLHIPECLGVNSRLDCPPLLLLYDHNHSHYEEARPQDISSETQLILLKEIFDCETRGNFLKIIGWKYKEPGQTSKESAEGWEGQIPLRTPDTDRKRKRKLYSTPTNVEEFSPQKETQEEGGGVSILESPVRREEHQCTVEDKEESGPLSVAPDSRTSKQGEKFDKDVVTQLSESAPKVIATDDRVSKKREKFDEDVVNSLAEAEIKNYKQLREELDEIVVQLPELKKRLKEVRKGEDVILEVVTEFKDDSDGQQFHAGTDPRKQGKKSTATIDTWKYQLREKIFPFLREKYPNIDLALLIDFEEAKEHDNYHRQDPPRTRQLHKFTTDDVKESVNISYVSLTNSASSKEQLLKAWSALARALAWKAKKNRCKFSRTEEANTTITHYTEIAEFCKPGLKVFQTNSATRRAEEEITGERERYTLQEMADIVRVYLNSEQRRDLLKTLDELSKSEKVVTQTQYVKMMELIQTEMVVSGPFRNAVWKKFPYCALSAAWKNPGWDPSNITDRADEVVETWVEEGITLRQTTDISKPPPSLACDHQLAGNIKCQCDLACKPCGYNVMLTWDKGGQRNKRNRYLHIPFSLYRSMAKFATIRDKYFTALKRGKGDAKGGESWFKGSCAFLLNGVGNQNDTFHMRLAKEIVGKYVTPHMFRRLFCTVLAYNQDQKVSKAQPQMCGQSASVFEEYYNLNTKSDAQALMGIISSFSSNILSEPSQMDDRLVQEAEERAEEEEIRLRQINEDIMSTEEQIDTHSFKNPIMKAQLASVLTFGTRMDKDLIVSHPGFDETAREALGGSRMTRDAWKKHLVRLASRATMEGEELREVLVSIFRGREELVRHKWSVAETMEERVANAKEKDKDEPHLSDPVWVLLDSLFSSVASKLRNSGVTKAGSMDYEKCMCKTSNSKCIHCQEPICKRCSR